MLGVTVSRRSTTVDAWMAFSPYGERAKQRPEQGAFSISARQGSRANEISGACNRIAMFTFFLRASRSPASAFFHRAVLWTRQGCQPNGLAVAIFSNVAAV